MSSEEIVLRSNTMKLRLKNTEIKIIKNNKKGQKEGLLTVEPNSNNSQYKFGKISNSMWEKLTGKYSKRINFIEKTI